MKEATQPVSPPSAVEASEGETAAPVLEPEPTVPVETPKAHRLRAATREAVEAKIAPRVEKLRHASNVVLEEASDDPNLRFVLIAVAIFLLALLFLWLNQVLG